MRYRAVRIVEEDYGCEGVPEGSEPMCSVLVLDESGEELWLTIADSFLTEHRIAVGDYFDI